MKTIFWRCTLYAGLTVLSVLLVLNIYTWSAVAGKAATPSRGFAEPDPVLVLKDAKYIETLDVSAATVYFRKISQEKGGKYGYDVLGKISPKWKTYEHMFGHVIGTELYKQEGLKGMTVCTTDFAFSCYHSVLGEAIAQQGIAAVRDINQVCVNSKDLWACQHGLGHGVLATVGYDDPFNALNVCAGLSDQGPINGCVEGVFMEHNSLTMLDPAMSKQRELDDKGLYYPCNAVESQYRDECYNEQPVWWRGIYGQDRYDKVALLCDGIDNDENKAWCFRKIGALIIEPVTMTASTSAEKCKAVMPNALGVAYCLQSVHQGIEEENHVCDSLEPEYKQVCESEAPAITYTKILE